MSLRTLLTPSPQTSRPSVETREDDCPTAPGAPPEPHPCPTLPPVVSAPPARKYAPLLPPLLAYAAGIAQSALLPPIRWPWMEILALHLVLALSFKLGSLASARRTLLALVFVAGSLTLPSPVPAEDRTFVPLDQEGPFLLQGTVVRAQRTALTRTQLVLEAESVEKPPPYASTPQPASGQVLLTLDAAPPETGVRLRCQVRLSRLEPAGNPDETDPRPDFARQALVRRGFVLPGGCIPYHPLQVLPPLIPSAPAETVATITDETARLLAWRESLRDELRRWYRQQAPGEAGLLMGLVLGDRAELDGDTRQAFARSGLAHLLAISGSHFSLVASGMEKFLSALLFFLLVPRAHRTRTSPWTAQQVAGCLAMLPTAGYALLVGLSPSIGRAVFMTLTALALKSSGRRVSGMALLTLAGAVVLGLEPTALWDVGTQLSFASVLALMTLAPRMDAWGLARFSPTLTTALPERWKESGSLAGRAVWLLFITSLAATLATAPLCALHFSTIPVVGILANLLAVPLLGSLCMPPLLVGSVFQLLGLPGASSLLALSVAIIRPGLSIAHYFGDPGLFPTIDWQPTVLQAALFGGILWGILQRGRFRTVMASSGAFVLLLSLAPACFRPPQPAQLTITQLNVGQGDGAVLELPDGRVVVIDAGGLPPGSRASSDPGERVVLPFLRARGHQRIDVMVLTHPHPDHMGGMQALAEALPVTEFWVAQLPDRSGSFQTLVNTLQSRGTHIFTLSRETPIAPLGDVKVRCLHPSRDWDERLSRKKDRSVNNTSLVLEFSFGDVQTLFTGDIESAVEAQLVKDQVLRPVEIVKIPHHGSNTSSTPEFIAALRPAIGLIGVGRDNRFGFPRRSTVRGWSTQGTQLFRTDQDGAISVETDGKTVWGKTWQPDRARTFTGEVTRG